MVPRIRTVLSKVQVCCPSTHTRLQNRFIPDPSVLLAPEVPLSCSLAHSCSLIHSCSFRQRRWQSSAMPSKRRRGRSRSPSRNPPQQQSGHRGYRQRDYHGHDRPGNSRNNRDNGNPQLNDTSGQHGLPDYFYDDPPVQAQQSSGPPSDRGRGFAQRGRGRGRGREPRHARPQSSNSRRDPMPPPAPKPPRPNEDKTKANAKSAPKKDRPKTIPLENRDKCGACSEYHDIRYCPYPNTEDGRTKICPICNTSKHAWFECWYYKKDVMEQWTVCWVNRRCLPTLVHDAPLDEIFYSRASLAREKASSDGPSDLESLNCLPGPLSPQFVKKLVPPDRENAWIQHELQDGRVVPWKLCRAALEDSGHRAQSCIRDESTIHMLIDGTRSSKENIPATIKHESFIMSDTMKANNEVYDQILAKKPLPTVKAVIPPRGRDFPNRRVGGGTCDNCGSGHHPPHHCLGPCKECGMSAPDHFGSLGYWCSRGCVCGPNPGHTRTACNSLCRPCMFDGDLNTELKDCKKHCPLHMCLTSDGRDHSWCAAEHKACPSCKERHWRQDCPKWLGDMCVRQDCLEMECKTHCAVCGGLGVDGIISLFQKNNVSYKQKVQSLVQTWHRYLDNTEWERDSITHTEYASWSVLRCRRHYVFTADAHTLEQARVGTWKKVVNCVRGGFTEGTIAEAERLLKAPECQKCRNERK